VKYDRLIERGIQESLQRTHPKDCKHFELLTKNIMNPKSKHHLPIIFASCKMETVISIERLGSCVPATQIHKKEDNILVTMTKSRRNEMCWGVETQLRNISKYKDYTKITISRSNPRKQASMK